MINESMVLELDVPVVSVIKEISVIDNRGIINQLYDGLVERGYNPLIVFFNNPDSNTIIKDDVLIIPEQLKTCDIPIIERVKALRNIIHMKVKEKAYNIILTESFGGVFSVDERENLCFLNIEIIEALDPDYIIAHIMASDYLMPQELLHQFELKTRRDIDAVVMSDVFFDIVKYNEDQTKRYLSFSQKTIRTLTAKLSKLVSIPVFSYGEHRQMSIAIEEHLSVDIGDCRRLNDYDGF